MEQIHKNYNLGVSEPKYFYSSIQTLLLRCFYNQKKKIPQKWPNFDEILDTSGKMLHNNCVDFFVFTKNVSLYMNLDYYIFFKNLPDWVVMTLYNIHKFGGSIPTKFIFWKKHTQNQLIYNFFLTILQYPTVQMRSYCVLTFMQILRTTWLRGQRLFLICKVAGFKFNLVVHVWG